MGACFRYAWRTNRTSQPSRLNLMPFECTTVNPCAILCAAVLWCADVHVGGHLHDRLLRRHRGCLYVEVVVHVAKRVGHQGLLLVVLPLTVHDKLVLVVPDQAEGLACSLCTACKVGATACGTVSKTICTYISYNIPIIFWLERYRVRSARNLLARAREKLRC